MVPMTHLLATDSAAPKAANIHIELATDAARLMLHNEARAVFHKANDLMREAELQQPPGGAEVKSYPLSIPCQNDSKVIQWNFHEPARTLGNLKTCCEFKVFWLRYWRRGSESNRRIKVLQTSALPLGYRALRESSYPTDTVLAPVMSTRAAPALLN
jgi:hypothetical protein